MRTGTKRSGRGRRDPLRLRGKAEIFVYRGDKLIDKITKTNIILYQGNAAVITTLATVPPVPYVVTRMAIGDQGTIPSSQTTPKVPVPTLTGLYHEVYRQDITQPATITNNVSGTPVVVPATLTNGNQSIYVPSGTADLAAGMSVTGTYIPTGSLIQDVTDSTHVVVTAAPTGIPGSGTITENVTFAGTANQAIFTATFDATSVATSAFSDPSNPIINEVGLVLINPDIFPGTSRPAVTAPNAPSSDEIVMSLLTFNSVPFIAATDISITIRYTLYMA